MLELCIFGLSDDRDPPPKKNRNGGETSTHCLLATSNKVDLCLHLLDSTWLPVQPAHTTLIKSLWRSRAMFWHLNVRILDWERLLLFCQELDKILYPVMLIFFLDTQY